MTHAPEVLFRVPFALQLYLLPKIIRRMQFFTMNVKPSNTKENSPCLQEVLELSIVR